MLEFFNVEHRLFFSSEDKILIVLNIKNLGNSFFYNNAVIYKKISSSYKTSIVGIFSLCFLNIFNMVFFPYVRVNSMRFSSLPINSFDGIDFNYFKNLFQHLFFQESFYKYSFYWQVNLNFTSRMKLWLCKHIYFGRSIVENYLFLPLEYLNLDLINKTFYSTLFIYTVGDLVRSSNVFIIPYLEYH